MKLLKRTQGYHTYFIAVVMIFLALLKGFKIIPEETYFDVQGVLVGLGLFTLRAGVSRDCKFR
jgi:hypothetical protein